MLPEQSANAQLAATQKQQKNISVEFILEWNSWRGSYILEEHNNQLGWWQNSIVLVSGVPAVSGNVDAMAMVSETKGMPSSSKGWQRFGGVGWTLRGGTHVPEHQPLVETSAPWCLLGVEKGLLGQQGGGLGGRRWGSGGWSWIYFWQEKKMKWWWMGRGRHPTCPAQSCSFSLGMMLDVLIGTKAAGWTAPSVSVVAQLQAAVLIPPQPLLCCPK
eukprot:scaffold98677_cov37-Attheya_sp.AAC.3